MLILQVIAIHADYEDSCQNLISRDEKTSLESCNQKSPGFKGQ